VDIYIHIEKKHIYALITIFIIAFSTVYVFAGAYSRFRDPVVGVSHYLQDIVKDDSFHSVDSDNNGFIDSSDACNGSATCSMNILKFNPQNPGLPTEGQIWIMP
jgi:hypothetical protein